MRAAGPPSLLNRPASGGVLHGRPAAPLFGSSGIRVRPALRCCSSPPMVVHAEVASFAVRSTYACLWFTLSTLQTHNKLEPVQGSGEYAPQAVLHDAGQTEPAEGGTAALTGFWRVCDQCHAPCRGVCKAARAAAWAAAAAAGAAAAAAGTTWRLGARPNSAPPLQHQPRSARPLATP